MYICANLAATAALAAATPRAGTTVLSNFVLPRDTAGRTLVTGEADVLALPNGSFYFYFNDWGDCPGVDCCATQKGCCCSNVGKRRIMHAYPQNNS